jgi:hypothetical protein
MKSNPVISPRVIAWGLPLMLLLSPGCRSTPPEQTGDSEAPTTTSEAPATSSEAQPGSDRRIFEGCVPAEAVERYESWAGEHVLITFAWKDMKGTAADLNVPAQIVRIDSPDVVVGFDPRVPNLDLYISVWTYSGHLEGRTDGAYGVDPCSATFEKGRW